MQLGLGISNKVVSMTSIAAIVAAMPTPMTAAHKLALATLVNTLRSQGIWQKFDLFYDFIGAEDNANLVINLANPGSYTATIVGTVAHVQGYGIKGDGTSGYLNTNWIPGTNGVNYQASNAHLGALETSNIGSATSPQAYVVGGGQAFLVPRTASNVFFANINVTSSGSSIGGTVTDSSGHTLASRNAANVVVYKNGISAVTISPPTTTAVTVRSLYILARNNSGVADFFSARLLNVFHAGADLTASEVALLSAALANYKSTMLSPYIYTSSVSYGGIPIGVDSNIGNAAAPMLTIDAAATLVPTNGTLYLNGNPAAPTVYTHSSILTQGPYTLQANESGGATVRATTAASSVININPLTGLNVGINGIKVDGNSSSLRGLQISAGTVPFNILCENMEISGIATGASYGIWDSNTASCASITLNACTISLANARSCVQRYLKAYGQVNIVGGTYTITNVNLSNGGFLELDCIEPGAELNISGGTTASVIIDAALSGSGVVGIDSANVKPTISDLVLSVDTTADATKTATGLHIRATNDVNAQDIGGFSVVHTDITITCRGSGTLIWVGYDGTTDADQSNGKLNGGVITRCNVAGGDALSQVNGLHGIAIASWADTVVSYCTVDTAGIGLIAKESHPIFEYCTVTDCTSSYMLYKGAQEGATCRNCTFISTLNNAGTHVSGISNPITGNNSTGLHENNHHVNDGAASIIFVDVAVGQDITFSGNTYYNRSGTLNAFPWRYHGVNYATFEEWQAAVEPNAVWADI